MAATALKVELFLAGAWVDITSYVRQPSAVTITHGRGAEATGPQPSVCRFLVDDNSGHFSPRNPLGQWYGQLGQNTPVRVTEAATVAFRGELTSLEPAWDLDHSSRTVQVEAGSVLRRLAARDTPEVSSMRRGYLFETSNVPIEYWPCEDGSDSVAFTSAYPNRKPLQRFGDVKPAQSQVFPASQPLPEIGTTGALYAAVGSYVFTGQFQLRFLLSVPAIGAADDTLLATLVTSGTLQWALYYKTGGGLRITALRNSDGVSVLDSTAGFALNGRPCMVSLEFTVSGTSINWKVGTLDAVTGAGGFTNGTLATQVMGYMLNLTMVPGTMAVGHVTMQTAVTSLFDLVDQLKAYAGERAGTRFTRLCTSRGVGSSLVGSAATTAFMGPQLPKTLLELLTECATADGGELYDARDASAIVYRTAASMESQTAKLTLSYSGHEVAAPLQPVDDDRAIINDVTAKRQGGGDFRVTLDSGPMSTAAPPDGVGRYDKSITVNVATDEQLQHAAGWLLHVGTVDESRYPSVPVNLSSPDVASVAAVLAVSIGDRVVITGMQAALVFDDLSQLVRGYTLQLATAYRHSAVFNAVPESPWHVPILDDADYGRLDSDTSSLNASITSSAGTLAVKTPTGPLWTTASGDRPFDILVGGERMRVTNVTGAASPQTFTVTRAINGVVKAHAANEAVHVFNPVYIGL